MEPFSPFIIVGIILVGLSLKQAIDKCKSDTDRNIEENSLIDDEVPPKYEEIYNN